MLTAHFRSLKGERLTASPDFRSGSWVRAETPTEAELAELVRRYGLDPGHLKDALDPLEVPRLEIERDAVYIYTRAPVRRVDGVQTQPLLIVFAETAIITVSGGPLPSLDALARRADLVTTQKTKLLLQLLAHVTQGYNAAVQEIARGIRNAGLQLRLESLDNRDIVRFVGYEGVLQDFLTSLTPTLASLEQLVLGKRIRFYEADQDLVEDLTLSTNQLIELCRSNLKTIVTIREAYSTIMTNNLNRVIKLLTSLTVILMVPNLVSGFYGMNIALPFAQHPLAFFGLLTFIGACSGLLLAVFWRNRWL